MASLSCLSELKLLRPVVETSHWPLKFCRTPSLLKRNSTFQSAATEDTFGSTGQNAPSQKPEAFNITYTIDRTHTSSESSFGGIDEDHSTWYPNQKHAYHLYYMRPSHYSQLASDPF